jgi:hypothetical protein
MVPLTLPSSGPRFSSFSMRRRGRKACATGGSGGAYSVE